MGNIPFKKENTFCFDSESFRYLVALQKNIPMNGLDRGEYETSWTFSAKESNRLIGYISNGLTTYRMQDEQKSIKNIQFEIIHMVRPMLEAMRNILRNIVLCLRDPKHKLLELCPTAIYRLATHCLSCKPKPIQVGKFWILPDFPHETHDKCLMCPCTLDQHTPIEYILELKCSTTSSNFNEIQNMLHPLFNASVEFAHFLKYVTRSTAVDPFITGLTTMLDEEKYVFDKVKHNDFNLQLVQQLENISRDYKRRIDGMKPDQWKNNMPIIHDQIKTVSEHPLIFAQMDAIKQSQEIMIKQHEYMK